MALLKGIFRLGVRSAHDVKSDCGNRTEKMRTPHHSCCAITVVSGSCDWPANYYDNAFICSHQRLEEAFAGAHTFMNEPLPEDVVASARDIDPTPTILSITSVA